MNDDEECNEVELRVLDLAVGGDFVADEIGDEKTSKVFLRNVISGERVRARVSQTGKNFRRAELLEVIEPSDARVSPRCPYFGICGGCDLQHVHIDEQRQIKRTAVENTFARKLPEGACGKVDLMGGELSGYGYRSRLKLHIDSSGRVGFFRQGSRLLVEIARCDVATDEVNMALEQLCSTELELGRYFSRVYVDADEQRISCAFVLRSQSVSRNRATELLAELKKNHSEVTWSLRSDRDDQGEHPGGYFFQANQEGNEVLRKLVSESISGKKVVDLYAGAGNFSIPLALAGREVVAVEINKELVGHGRRMAAGHGLDQQLRFHRNAAEQFMQRYDANGISQSLILDPPRTGALEVVRSIQPESFPEIVYVSCSLPSFVRDSAELLLKGYALEKVTVIDMFPQTHHIELLAVFRCAPE